MFAWLNLNLHHIVTDKINQNCKDSALRLPLLVHHVCATIAEADFPMKDSVCIM